MSDQPNVNIKTSYEKFIEYIENDEIKNQELEFKNYLENNYIVLILKKLEEYPMFLINVPKDSLNEYVYFIKKKLDENTMFLHEELITYFTENQIDIIQILEDIKINEEKFKNSMKDNNIDYDLIKTYPMFLEYLIEEIIYDQIKLENILKDNPLALQYLPKIIYNYDHFCEIAVENNIAALQFAENLKNDLYNYIIKYNYISEIPKILLTTYSYYKLKNINLVNIISKYL